MGGSEGGTRGNEGRVVEMLVKLMKIDVDIPSVVWYYGTMAQSK